jgi:hypothetical protein
MHYWLVERTIDRDGPVTQLWNQARDTWLDEPADGLWDQPQPTFWLDEPDAVALTGDPTATAVRTDLVCPRLRDRRTEAWLRPALDRYCAGGEPDWEGHSPRYGLGAEPFWFRVWLHGYPCPVVDWEYSDWVSDYIDFLVENDPRFVRVRLKYPSGTEDDRFMLRNRASPAVLAEAARQARDDWGGCCPPAEQFE